MILSPDKAEFLLLNLNAAVKVRQRSDFYLWAQGELQALLPHDLLMCCDCSGGEERARHRIDLFSREPLEDEARIRHALERGGFIRHIAETWRRGRQAVCFREPGALSRVPGIPPTLDGRHLAWHGTIDHRGGITGLFVVARRGPFDAEVDELLLELVVPHLSCAFARVAFAAGKVPLEESNGNSLLTGRQLEILRYVRQGKSNNEIGELLEISPLTVKNHLQVVLRKLNAQNRTQAVSFGIEQRLI